MADLEALARRVEAEEPSPNLWLAAWFEGNPTAATRDTGRFGQLFAIGAYLDAADMLRPPSWRPNWISYGTSGHVGVCLKDHGETVTAGADGPHAEARARVAAALRARAQGGPDA